MSNQIDYKKLAEAYFSGRIAKDDQRVLDAWLRTDGANMQSFREWESAWAASAAAKTQTDAAWEKFKSLTSAQKIENTPKQTIPPLASRRWAWGEAHFIYWAAAAALLLMMALPVMKLAKRGNNVAETLVAQNTTPERITISGTTTPTYFLPDSSLVRLASGAEVAYMSDYGTGIRAIELVGEARFEVTKNTDCPFTVAASEFVVEVTGTQFTVKADSAAATASVELHEGSVQVHYADSTYLLSPGEELTYYKEKTQMRYTRQSLGGLLNRLSRHYHRPIVFEDASEMQQYVRYTFRPGQELEDVLEALCLIYPLEVNYEGETCFVRIK